MNLQRMIEINRDIEKNYRANPKKKREREIEKKCPREQWRNTVKGK